MLGAESGQPQINFGKPGRRMLQPISQFAQQFPGFENHLANTLGSANVMGKAASFEGFLDFLGFGNDPLAKFQHMQGRVKQ